MHEVKKDHEITKIPQKQRKRQQKIQQIPERIVKGVDHHSQLH